MDSHVLHFWVWLVSELVPLVVLSHVTFGIFYHIRCCGLEHPHSLFLCCNHTNPSHLVLAATPVQRTNVSSFFFARFLDSMLV